MPPQQDDAIYFGDLNRDTREAIARWYAANEWEDIGGRTWLSLDTCATMFFRMRAVKGADIEIFPHGKWATIQRLETMIDAVVRRQVNPDEPTPIAA